MADSGMILSFPSEWRDVQNTKTADRAIYWKENQKPIEGCIKRIAQRAADYSEE
jgi:hypothetical protein